jgi:hypothetical protein
VTFVVFVTFAVVGQSGVNGVAFEFDDQIKRYKDLVKRTSDLRSYL